MLYPVLLDEKALRRETFTPGEPVILWDGQEWHFPRPRVRWPEYALEDDAPTSLGPEFDAASRAIRESDDEAADPTAPLFDLAASMLLVNYDLTRDDLSGLLAYDPSDPENMERWGEIMDAAAGNAEATLARWRRLSLWSASGPPAGWVDLADVNDFLGMLVQMGRAIPANRWVSELIEEEQARANDAAGPA